MAPVGMVRSNGGRFGCVSTQQDERAERIRRRFTNWGSTLLGFGIIGYQSFILDPEKVQWMLLVVGLSLLGVPTGVAAVSQIRNSGGPERTDVVSSGGPPPSPLPPS